MSAIQLVPQLTIRTYCDRLKSEGAQAKDSAKKGTHTAVAASSASSSQSEARGLIDLIS